MQFSELILGIVTLLPTFSMAQLSATVGPSTKVATKTAKKTCSVLDFGGKADKTTDLGPPLASAFAACKTGGTVVVPEGDYAMKTWVTLNGGSAWALQLDGIIHRTGNDGGNMIFIRNSDDFEMFSSTGKGAIQGNGYEIHAQGSRSGARILRLNKVTNFAVHDLVLVDAPAFHFSLDTCENGEVYNLAIRGGDWGGLDGIDVWSNNIWIHDVMVTNKDECVTVKSPSKNILIENVYCNWSGGCALGSLGANTAISQVHYKNVYTSKSNQMMMIKSNGGSGYVENVVFENFIGHGNAYSLNIDQYWPSMSAVEGDGVQLSNLTFNNWRGTEANGAQRGPVRIRCADEVPCTDIKITGLVMWTEIGSTQIFSCQSGYGSGFCLKSGSGGVYTTTSTQTTSPTGFSAPTMAEDLKTAFGTTVSIPIPTLPTSYYPGVTPYSKIAGT